MVDMHVAIEHQKNNNERGHRNGANTCQDQEAQNKNREPLFDRQHHAGEADVVQSLKPRKIAHDFGDFILAPGNPAPTFFLLLVSKLVCKLVRAKKGPKHVVLADGLPVLVR